MLDVELEKGKGGLPRLVLIADGFVRVNVADQVVAAVKAGVGAVQLRDHEAALEDFAAAATGLLARMRTVRPDVSVWVNGRVDVAERLGVGVHLGRRGPSVAEARARLGKAVVIGYSAHGLAEAQDAVAAGADYLYFSPVFATRSHPETAPTGLHALATVCETHPGTPVFALGGITPDRAAACRAAGAHGVAVLSGLLHADDVAGATAAYLTALDRSTYEPRPPTPGPGPHPRSPHDRR